MIETVSKLAAETASVTIDWAAVIAGVQWHQAPSLIDGKVTIAGSQWEGACQTVLLAGGMPGRSTQVILRADPNGDPRRRRARSVTVHVLHDWRDVLPALARVDGGDRLQTLIQTADPLGRHALGGLIAEALRCQDVPDAVRSSLSRADSPEAENALFDRLSLALDKARSLGLAAA